MTTQQEARHILNVSGGKDSSALAIYMKDREMWRERLLKNTDTPVVPVKMEYVFCDTGEELPETYEYLEKLEAQLDQEIIRLKEGRGFQHWLEVYGNFLPSAQMRWCTVQLKIKPFERYVADDQVLSYIGIRADEDRDGYGGNANQKISSKPNVKPIYPFREDGIVRDDVFRILDESGIGLPDYYRWRTRSGCYFCFFQRKAEWVGLLENHPDLFEKAKAFEKVDPVESSKFTWSQGESLEELSGSLRVERIKEHHEKVIAREKREKPNRSLAEIFAEVLDQEDDNQACNICHI